MPPPSAATRITGLIVASPTSSSHVLSARRSSIVELATAPADGMVRIRCGIPSADVADRIELEISGMISPSVSTGVARSLITRNTARGSYSWSATANEPSAAVQHTTTSTVVATGPMLSASAGRSANARRMTPAAAMKPNCNL